MNPTLSMRSSHRGSRVVHPVVSSLEAAESLSRLELQEELQTFLLKSLGPEIERAVEKALLSALSKHSRLHQNGSTGKPGLSFSPLHSFDKRRSSMPLQAASAAFAKTTINTEVDEDGINLSTTGFHERAMKSFAVRYIAEAEQAKADAAKKVQPPQAKPAWGAMCLPNGRPNQLQATGEFLNSQGKSGGNWCGNDGALTGGADVSKIRNIARHSLHSLPDVHSMTLPGSIQDSSNDVKDLRHSCFSCTSDDDIDIAIGHDRPRTAPGRVVTVKTDESFIEAQPSTEDEQSDVCLHDNSLFRVESVRRVLDEAPDDYYVQKVERNTRIRSEQSAQEKLSTSGMNMLGIGHAEAKHFENTIYAVHMERRRGTVEMQWEYAVNESRRCGTFFEESRFCKSLRKIVKNEYFDYFMGVFLALNAISIGIQADYMASNLDQESPPFHLRLIEVVFCIIFFLELVARIAVHKTAFFTGKNWQWHAFDTVVVFFSVTDELSQLLLTDTKIQEVIENLGVLRMLRLMRVVRLVRMVRLIPALKSMVYLISASMWSFFWTVVLLNLMMYCVAVYFTDIGTDIARDMDPAELDKAKALGNDEPTILSCWGGVGNSILSLWLAISGGDDWRNFIDVFFSHSSYLINTIVFSLYIAFTTLVMLNLVTGVFVEGAQRIIREDKDSELLKLACRLFAHTDKDGSYDITWEEFRAQLDTREMDDYFKAVDLSRTEAKDLFKLLDLDHSGSISIEEFVKGCLRLRGPARSVDLMALVYDFKLKNSQLQECLAVMDDNMLRLADMMKRATRETYQQQKSLRNELSVSLAPGVCLEEYLV